MKAQVPLLWIASMEQISEEKKQKVDKFCRDIMLRYKASLNDSQLIHMVIKDFNSTATKRKDD